MLEDTRQLLYIQCTHVNCSGISCTNPVPKYLLPSLCGDHWFEASLQVPVFEQTDNESEDEQLETENITTIWA